MGAGYVRIDPAYDLRGWQGLPHALVNRATGRASFVPEAVFHTLQLCNGKFTADSPLFMGARKDHLRALEDAGVLSFSDEPSELDSNQEYRYFDNRYIWQVHWSLTGRCNYRCKHCYMSAPHAVLPQPSTEECLAIADQIAACGVPCVSLTGGEPLIRPDFLRIVDRLLAGGVHIATIMTNGSLVTEKLLDELEARGVRCEFNMSYDGTQGCHDWLRGVPGADDAVQRAFAICRKHGFPTGSELALHRGNARTLRESVKLLGELGVGSLKVSPLRCVGEGTALTDYALSSDEEYETYLEYLPQYVEDGMPVPGLMLSRMFSVRNGRLSITCERYPEGGDCSRKPMCHSVRMIMYLGPDGRILPCLAMSRVGFRAGALPAGAGDEPRRGALELELYRLLPHDLGFLPREESPVRRLRIQEPLCGRVPREGGALLGGQLPDGTRPGVLHVLPRRLLRPRQGAHRRAAAPGVGGGGVA